MKLPINKRIEPINCTRYNNYGIVTDQRILLFSKHFEGFPALFIDGIKIEGANSRIELESFLTGIVGKDFINPEYNYLLYAKECEFNKKGLFRGKIICN